MLPTLTISCVHGYKIPALAAHLPSLPAMSAKQSPPSNLVAFPSVSASLCHLPHATSMQNVALHPSMYANRAAESEAKLQKALSSKANSSAKTNPVPLAGPPLESSNSSSPPLMMNLKKPKPKFHT
ncbi:hypothetical protein AX14_005752 [Amanita brunnescens Koide BX004]|nr:hypothetical protein AX14_005752 [Amanita brunnescens Koide BX004]